MAEPGERRARGEAMYREVVGGEPPPVVDPYTGAVLDTVFGELWTRPGLTRKERRLITLSCAGAASSPPAIEGHLRGALDSGDLTLEEVQEFILHFAFYAGWPKAAAVHAALGAYQARQQRSG
jgi:4-carboxymuconolactone decarboxylase